MSGAVRLSIVRRFGTLAVVAVAASLVAAPVRVALGLMPPEAYRQLQREAPEALEITAVSVDVKRSPSQDVRGREYIHRSIAVVARVERVERSALGLAPGATLNISYSIGEPMPGPGYPPEIEPQQRYMAYLRCSGAAQDRPSCSPVAYGSSFVRPAEPRP